MTDLGAVSVPGGDQVHVWWIDLARMPTAAHVVLSPEERDRARRFRRPADAARWMSARAALRQILAGYLGVSPASVTFGPAAEGLACRAPTDHRDRGPDVKPSPQPLSRRAGRGAFTAKPALLTETRLRFNFAHAGARAALAVAWEREVGIDLETFDASVDVAPLLTVACSPAETARIEAQPEAERAKAFLTHWTVKEAYLKSIGLGLFREPRAVEVELLGDDRAQVRDGRAEDAALRWDVRILDAGSGWAAALAVERVGSELQTFAWPPP